MTWVLSESPSPRELSALLMCCYCCLSHSLSATMVLSTTRNRLLPTGGNAVWLTLFLWCVGLRAYLGMPSAAPRDCSQSFFVMSSSSSDCHTHYIMPPHLSSRHFNVMSALVPIFLLYHLVYSITTSSWPPKSWLFFLHGNTCLSWNAVSYAKELLSPIVWYYNSSCGANIYLRPTTLVVDRCCWAVGVMNEFRVRSSSDLVPFCWWPISLSWVLLLEAICSPIAVFHKYYLHFPS